MDPDRPRGILSKADREYLKDPDSVSRQTKYNRKEAIVERTHEAIYDLALLKATLPKDVREEIFQQEVEGREPAINEFSSALGFLFLMASDLDSAHKSEVEILEDFIGSAVKSMYNEKGKIAKDVSVSIEVDLVGDLPTIDELDNLTLDEAVEKLESDELTAEVLLGYLMQREAEEKIANGEADEDEMVVLDGLDVEVADGSDYTGVGYDLRKFSAFNDSEGTNGEETTDDKE